jgi:hypothetical protein
MRIVVWNMSHWQKSDELRREAWGALKLLEPDVALVQEAVPPPDLSQAYRPIGGARPWGSAVVGLTTRVKPVDSVQGRYNTKPASLLQTFPGSVAIASAQIEGNELVFVSMYGVIDNGYADTTVQRQLSDLVPLFDNASMSGRIVLGGDLNITTQWNGSQSRYRAWEATTLARIRAFGLVDCLDDRRAAGPLAGCACEDGEACRHVRTQRHSRSNRPWQNDYVFASEALLKQGQIIRAEAIDTPEWRPLSEHMPLVLDLDLNGRGVSPEVV